MDIKELMKLNGIESMKKESLEEKYQKLEERFNKLVQMQDLSVKQIDEYQFEVVKPSFDVDNPIPYVDGMELVNNAFYLKDGKVYVWMNEWIEWEV